MNNAIAESISHEMLSHSTCTIICNDEKEARRIRFALYKRIHKGSFPNYMLQVKANLLIARKKELLSQ